MFMRKVTIFTVGFILFGCSALGNIESASEDLMIIEEDYATYEWKKTDKNPVPLEEVLKDCKQSISVKIDGYISKSTAYKELESCLKRAGWERELTEIILYHERS
jgi:hypothetical protein